MPDQPRPDYLSSSKKNEKSQPKSTKQPAKSRAAPKEFKEAVDEAPSNALEKMKKEVKTIADASKGIVK